MKNTFNYLFIIILTPIILSGQNMKTVSVESNKIIDINEEVSWNIVKDWSNLHNLVPEIVESTTVFKTGLGSTWEINLKNGGKIIEKMTYYNVNDRIMSYVMTETPMPIKEYSAIIKVEPYGITKSMVSFHISCLTSDNNFEKIRQSFKAFQETYLSNIINQENE